jgi:hypothetical protein
VSRAAIADTGPLVAFLDRAERQHAWASALGQHEVLTLDSDFAIYRKHGREPLALIRP